jgi:hypothetical protein
MKTRISALIAFALFAVVACEGPTGPAGPAGQQGPEGPQGSNGQSVQVSRWVGSAVLDQSGSAYIRLPEGSGTLDEPPLISCYMDRGDGNLWLLGMPMGGPHCVLQKQGAGLEVMVTNATEWHGKNAYVSVLMVQ